MTVVPEEQPATPPDTVQVASARLAAMLRDDPHRLRRRSVSLGVPVDDADDAAQTVALRAWRSLPALHSTDAGPMCAWLDVIARTTAIDMHRTRKETLGEVMCEQLEASDDVESAVETSERLAAALRAIERLPDELRRPLLLSAVDGLAATDIAQQLGISPAAARQRISRARKALDAGRTSPE
ncbi:RNA polymerase sigma factor [Microbacterium sp. 1P06AB]|uniref:RNA polymerase sigma factor n=1 Tax=Microbacterium sp. 1P06AB TaxID=3132289 RepID=UPI0039A4E3E8